MIRRTGAREDLGQGGSSAEILSFFCFNEDFFSTSKSLECIDALELPISRMSRSVLESAPWNSGSVACNV